VPRHVLALSDAERSRKLAAIAATARSWFGAAPGWPRSPPPRSASTTLTGAGHARHPIRAVRAVRGRLELDLVGRPRARAFGRRRLWLVGRRGDRQVRLTADLPALGRERPIVDLADGTAAGRCRLDGPPWRRHVVLEATGLDAIRPLWGTSSGGSGSSTRPAGCSSPGRTADATRRGTLPEGGRREPFVPVALVVVVRARLPRSPTGKRS